MGQFFREQAKLCQLQNLGLRFFRPIEVEDQGEGQTGKFFYYFGGHFPQKLVQRVGYLLFSVLVYVLFDFFFRFNRHAIDSFVSD